ncbi:hypothetical protein AYO22_10455 [Fonsecaea multimorphosa]|nr:hypothetical protein AYO22_10455 [Fonsecaea multimorphosa]
MSGLEALGAIASTAQMVTNVDNLLALLKSSLRQVTDKSIKRFWKAIVNQRHEAQILQSFTALENDKSSLLLYLGSIHGHALQQIEQHLSQAKTMASPAKSGNEDTPNKGFSVPWTEERARTRPNDSRPLQRQAQHHSDEQGTNADQDSQQSRAGQSATNNGDTHQTSGTAGGKWYSCRVEGRNAKQLNGHEIRTSKA